MVRIAAARTVDGLACLRKGLLFPAEAQLRRRQGGEPAGHVRGVERFADEAQLPQGAAVVSEVGEELGALQPVEGDQLCDAAALGEGHGPRGMSERVSQAVLIAQGDGDRVLGLSRAREVLAPGLDPEGLVVVPQGRLRLAVESAGAAQAREQPGARVVVGGALELHEGELQFLEAPAVVTLVHEDLAPPVEDQSLHLGVRVATQDLRRVGDDLLLLLPREGCREDEASPGQCLVAESPRLVEESGGRFVCLFHAWPVALPVEGLAPGGLDLASEAEIRSVGGKAQGLVELGQRLVVLAAGGELATLLEVRAGRRARPGNSGRGGGRDQREGKGDDVASASQAGW